MVSVDDKTIAEIHLSAGDKHDSPEGRNSIESLDKEFPKVPVLMDKAYEGDETRACAERHGYKAVVPPKSNRIDPWEYDKELYKKRNVVERFFRRIKEFRRICTRYDKTDIMFLGYVYFVIILLWIK